MWCGLERERKRGGVRENARAARETSPRASWVTRRAEVSAVTSASWVTRRAEVSHVGLLIATKLVQVSALCHGDAIFLSLAAACSAVQNINKSVWNNRSQRGPRASSSRSASSLLHSRRGDSRVQGEHDGAQWPRPEGGPGAAQLAEEGEHGWTDGPHWSLKLSPEVCNGSSNGSLPFFVNFKWDLPEHFVPDSH